MKKKNSKKRSPTVVPCKWLRDHNASMKPQKDSQFTTSDDETYWRLTDGSIVHGWNLKRLGL